MAVPHCGVSFRFLHGEPGYFPQKNGDVLLIAGWKIHFLGRMFFCAVLGVLLNSTGCSKALRTIANQQPEFELISLLPLSI